jgi:hypothetical protein
VVPFIPGVAGHAVLETKKAVRGFRRRASLNTASSLTQQARGFPGDMPAGCMLP